MAKYNSCMATNDVCKAEVAEVRKILKKYKVNKEDTNIIIGALKEAYYQFHEVCAGGRAMDRILGEILSDDCYKEMFPYYMELKAEEDKKFPFDIDDEDEDEGE